MSKQTIILDNVQIGFPNLFKPRASKFNPAADPKYSAMLVIPQGDTLVKVKAAIAELIKQDFEDGAGVRDPLILAWDSPTGAYAGAEVYKDKWLLNASNKVRPSVVNSDCMSLSPDQAEALIYPGAVVNAWVTVSTYNRGSQGVGCYLEGIQHVGDGERLDFRKSADQMFKPLGPKTDVPSFLDITP
jgi:hypothetical protein